MRVEIIYPPLLHSLSTVSRPSVLSVLTCRGQDCPRYVLQLQYIKVHYSGVTVQYSAVQCSTDAVQMIPGIQVQVITWIQVISPEGKTDPDTSIRSSRISRVG